MKLSPLELSLLVAILSIAAGGAYKAGRDSQQLAPPSEPSVAIYTSSPESELTLASAPVEHAPGPTQEELDRRARVWAESSRNVVTIDSSRWLNCSNQGVFSSGGLTPGNTITTGY